ncbi:UNVERIFIED_CONTAM: slc16a12 [Trichonephila clavipes]
MKSRGVDSAESWKIAAASIIINFLILAPARLSGVLFVAFMDRYNVDREQASLPFTLCYILRTLPGPLAGYLAERFGLRRMSIIGCILSTIGVTACFIAEDIITVTIFLGGCYGIGYGFVCSLIPEFLNQYFDKHLAKANGLAMGGAGIGAFVIPPIVEILIHTLLDVLDLDG